MTHSWDFRLEVLRGKQGIVSKDWKRALVVENIERWEGLWILTTSVLIDFCGVDKRHGGVTWETLDVSQKEVEKKKTRSLKSRDLDMGDLTDKQKGKTRYLSKV